MVIVSLCVYDYLKAVVYKRRHLARNTCLWLVWFILLLTACGDIFCACERMLIMMNEFRLVLHVVATGCCVDGILMACHTHYCGSIFYYENTC